jgi:hypothetical protein
MRSLEGERDDIPATTRTAKQTPFRLVGRNNTVKLTRCDLLIPWRRINDTDTRKKNRNFWLLFLLRFPLPFRRLMLDGSSAKQAVEPLTNPAK